MTSPLFTTFGLVTSRNIEKSSKGAYFGAKILYILQLNANHRTVQLQTCVWFLDCRGAERTMACLTASRICLRVSRQTISSGEGDEYGS